MRVVATSSSELPGVAEKHLVAAAGRRTALAKTTLRIVKADRSMRGAVVKLATIMSGFSCLRMSCCVALASAAFYCAPSLVEINSRYPTLALGILGVIIIKDYIIPPMLAFCYVGPHMSIRRKVMISTWDEPGRSGEIYTKLLLDMTEAYKYIEKKKGEGKKITVTHMVLKAMANALKSVPTVNGRVVFGRFVPFDTVDISCLVKLDDGKDLAMARISDADKKDVFEIAEILNQKASKLHDGSDEDYNKTKNTMRMLPTGILHHVLHNVGWLASGLGLNFSSLGVKQFPFGGCMISSIGAMGIESAYIPFTPWARVPVVICIGTIADRPVVVESAGQKEVTVRPMLTLTGTIDHRFIDGAQGAHMFREIRETFANPDGKMLASS
mmetsp:Transcript_71127/g.189855  ORF Transcript_71127/g.189855 Transcript_71127/m.189855 type:complete len:384 (-) Transcript_71127:281-1432(-)